MTSIGRALPNRLFQDDGWQARNVLDLRTSDRFRRLHLSGTVSFPLARHPLAHWSFERLADEIPSIFLPPRHAPLLVVGEDESLLARVAEHLRGRGRPRVSALRIDEDFLAALPRELVASGPARGVLWSPPPFLVAWADLLPPPAAGPVLDLGCGSGRSCVWLAEKGYRVTGIDWQGEALALGERLATSRSTHCEFRTADLRDIDAVPHGPWAVIVNFRYLQRDLLSRFARLLAPGGVALVRTFLDVPGYRGHPHLRHRLGRGELLRYFPAGQFEILVHDEGHDPDGRPAAGIVARKINEL